MGNSATHLPYPITSKFLQRRSAHSSKIRVGSSEMQGFRLAMEDALDIQLPKPKGEHEEERALHRLSYFGVFDGHGGEKASMYVAERLHTILFANADPKKPANIMQAVLKVDEEFLTKKSDRKQGTTAVFAIVEPLSESEQKKKKNEGGFKVIVGNLGDSRALLVRSTGRFLPLTKDHKPDNFLERQRIEAAGGSVSFHRVDGDLAVSRAIGDWTFKNTPDKKADEQKVIAVPEVSVAIARPGDSLLLCCDGLFERLTSKQVAGFIYREVTSEKQAEDFLDPADIAARLLELSLRCGSGDNMSAVLVCFMPEKDQPAGLGPGLPSPSPSPTLSIGTAESSESKGSDQTDATATPMETTIPTGETLSSQETTVEPLKTSGGSEESVPSTQKFASLPHSLPSTTPPATGTQSVTDGRIAIGAIGRSSTSPIAGAGRGAGGLEADAELVKGTAAPKKKWDTLLPNEYVAGQVPPKANRLYMQAYKNDAQKCKARLS